MNERKITGLYPIVLIVLLALEKRHSHKSPTPITKGSDITTNDANNTDPLFISSSFGYLTISNWSMLKYLTLLDMFKIYLLKALKDIHICRYVVVESVFASDVLLVYQSGLFGSQLFG